MDKIDVPSLNRKSREAESRTATARRKPWAPPSKLDAPPAPPGYKHRDRKSTRLNSSHT